MFKCFICEEEILGEDERFGGPLEPFSVHDPVTLEDVRLCRDCFKENAYACASCGQDFLYVASEDGPFPFCGHVDCYNPADSHPSNFDNVARDRHGNPWSDQFGPEDLEGFRR
jgi:hypothetical protein